MEAINSVAPISISEEADDFDEVSMQQSLIFSDSLEDLKNLRMQLYSAAEYFEVSYRNDDQKQIVANTLKDYAIKALINTVGHLGSVSYKVNDMLDENADEVSGTELCVSCVEQRLRTCQDYIDREGLSQQSLVINTPKYHKRYILPVGENMNGVNGTKTKHLGCSLDDEDDWRQFRIVQATTIRESPPTFRKEHSPPPPRLSQHSRTLSLSDTTPRIGSSTSSSPHLSQQPGSILFPGTIPRKELGKRTVSLHQLPLLHTESLPSQPTTPKKSRPTLPYTSRPTTPNPSIGRQYISEPRKSVSMRFPSERENARDTAHNPSKTRRFLKGLLSRRKSKKDDMLYTYLDEY